MQWNDGYDERIYTFANNINTHEGGCHLSGFKSALTRTINSYAEQGAAVEGPEGDARPARTRARVWPRSSRSSCPTRSSRGRPRPSSATPR